MTEPYVQPAWQKLLFASSADLAAAPSDVREDYFKFVEALSTRPEDFGMRHEDGNDFFADGHTDARIAAANHDWVS